MESGQKDINYFENNGTKLDAKEEDKKATAVVNITENGDYTIYAEDEAGNKTIQTVNITEIKEEEPNPKPPSDTTPPVIIGVEDGRTYKNYVTPEISDENLKTITLIKDGKTVESYENGDQIKENGEYTLIATDEAGNETKVSFTIEIKEDEEDNNSTNTNNNQSGNTNSIGNNTSDNNLGNTNTSGNNGTGNTNSVNNNTNNSNNNSNTNNHQSNESISGGNGNNRVNTNNRNTQNSNIATNRLPYAGFKNIILCFIIGVGLVSVFCYIKYRKYRKM